jgi:hypothetical protein
MLQVVGPFIPTGIIPKQGLATLLREVMKSSDFPVDDIIPDPKLEQQLQNAAGGPPQGGPPGAQPQGGPPGMPPEMGMPPGAPTGPAGGPPPALGAPQPPGTQGAPAMEPMPPGQGTGLMPQPDGRSGAAAAVLTAQQRGGL